MSPLFQGAIFGACFFLVAFMCRVWVFLDAVQPVITLLVAK